MKDIFFLLSLAALAAIAYDDFGKREDLKQAQFQMQQSQAETRLLQVQLQNSQVQASASDIPQVQSTPAPPTWFQQHLNQGTSLDMSRPHRP